MFTVKDKRQARVAVKRRIRRKVVGATGRPRLTVFRSLKHIYAQAIDDESGTTVAHASSVDKDVRGTYGGNVSAASAVGERIAERLLAQGLDHVVFDRSGYVYHGRVKALAEAARKTGLKF